MILKKWNELSVEELGWLHDEECYCYVIKDGRIEWAKEEQVGV